MFVQSGKSLGGRFNVFSRQVPDASILHHANKPPIAVAVVEKHHSISLRSVCLPIDGCDEIVECVDEFEINVLCSSLDRKPNRDIA